MKITRESKIGFVAIVVIVVSIWGYHFLKGKNIINPTDAYYVEYERIEGLIESGSVYYRGYKVGNINEIFFDENNPQRFYVKIVLEKNLKIPLNSTVLAKASNMISSAKDLHLEFTDTNAYHNPGDTLSPAYDKGIMGVLDPIQEQFSVTMEQINKLLVSLNGTLNDNTQKDLQKTIHSLNSLSSSLAVMAGPNGKLGKTISNFEAVSSTLESKKDKLGTSLDNLANISADLDSANLSQTLARLDSTLKETQSIMKKINEKEGSLGLLINDSALYLNLASSTAHLDSLLIDLKEHPKRYVHLSVFGKKDK